MKKIIKNKILKYSKAFSLIELLVATSIFTIISLAAIMILMSSQKLYKRISTGRIASDNTNLILESMSREIKFGKNYSCVNNTNINTIFIPSATFDYQMPMDSIQNSCNAIAFIPQDASNTKVIFYFNVSSSSIMRADYDEYDNLISNSSLNSKEININTFWVDISGSLPDDNIQPKVKIFLSGIVNLVRNNQGLITATSTFKIQSIFSQKVLDN